MVNRHRYLSFLLAFALWGREEVLPYTPVYLYMHICIHTYIHSCLLACLLVAAEELCMYVGGRMDG